MRREKSRGQVRINLGDHGTTSGFYTEYDGWFLSSGVMRSDGKRSLWIQGREVTVEPLKTRSRVAS